MIAIALAVLIGIAPHAVAADALRNGRRWAPVAALLAALWLSVFALQAADLVSRMTLASSVLVIIAVWQTSARKFGSDMREQDIG